MRVKHVRVKSFRLLADAELAFDERATVIVGRNNSGKTSLSEVMQRLLTGSGPSFRLEDFSAHAFDAFWRAFESRRDSAPDDEVRSLLPSIELRLTIEYTQSQQDLGPLGPFIVDLDPECREAIVLFRYELKDGALGALLDPDPSAPIDSRETLLRSLRDRIPKHFASRVWALDPGDSDNQRELDMADARRLVRANFINAQRGLDDVTSRDSRALARIVEALFSNAASTTAMPADRQIAEGLAAIVGEIQERLDSDFGNRLSELLPALNSFGYPGLRDQQLRTETSLDVSKLLSDFTRISYEGYGGVALPEGYNGLGVRNLIFILLQIAQYHRDFCADEVGPGVHLVFIEEPEAHLHPQMQEVFIRQLISLVQLLVERTVDRAEWPVQFVVTTHSSHVANAAGFERIRYFLSDVVAPAAPRRTRIKDLRRGLPGVDAETRDFLQQYLTLTRCDLFFADKAALVEGTSERLLFLPMIRKLEIDLPDLPKLSTQYLTIMEVGGNYAHLFFDLLDFLELPTLIITDLDAVEAPGGAACEVSSGTVSSNPCLKRWFGADAPVPLQDLLAAPGADRLHGARRIAYQCPEAANGPCGRTFEDAFILANRARFEIPDGTSGELEAAALRTARASKKTTFALKHAIKELDWSVPTYILDGLRWLAAYPAAPDAVAEDRQVDAAAPQVGADA